ncbi:HupE/UreJ family protein [Ensifer aridi]|uniref:HupE/UreJ family protein n=1 Tax=Ensifer aridi TaxID=1708715 RepID=UPI0003F6FD5D|nr:HupE/UreJ family protein [Ensifer aridi]
MIFRTIAALAAALLITLPGRALAHIGDHVRGIENGFLHPFSGLDHLLAMVAVGLIAARLGGPALWQLPVAFISAMVAGAAVAVTGMTVPLVEAAILASMIICGAALIIDANVPVTLAVTGTAAFAFFHGLAHGTEGPAAAPLGYILGFIGGTAILHMAGVAAYRGVARYDVAAAAALRIAGTVIMGAGVGLAYVA